MNTETEALQIFHLALLINRIGGKTVNIDMSGSSHGLWYYIYPEGSATCEKHDYVFMDMEGAYEKLRKIRHDLEVLLGCEKRKRAERQQAAACEARREAC